MVVAGGGPSGKFRETRGDAAAVVGGPGEDRGNAEGRDGDPDRAGEGARAEARGLTTTSAVSAARSMTRLEAECAHAGRHAGRSQPPYVSGGSVAIGERAAGQVGATTRPAGRRRPARPAPGRVPFLLRGDDGLGGRALLGWRRAAKTLTRPADGPGPDRDINVAFVRAHAGF